MNNNENRKVIKITDEIIENRNQVRSISTEQLQREFYYIQAEKIMKNMLEKDLITQVEFKKINALNRQVFHPALSEIMP